MASADIQGMLDSQPPELPYTVPVVTADGRPTQHLIDFSFRQSQWFRNNVITADQRVDTVKATADNASAAVTTESNARVAADEALSEQITTVDAKANSATANGQIYFAAHAAPSGATAAYGIYLTAGSAFTGLELLAMSDGTSAIGMAAGSLVFTDSGTTKQVLTYSGGLFTFTADVAVNGNLINNGSILTAAIADNAVTHGASATGDATGATLTVTARSGDIVLVWVSVQPLTQAGGLTGTASPVVSFNSGAATKTLRLGKFAAADGLNYWSPACIPVVFNATTTGTQTITVGPVGSAGEVEMLLTALAVSK